MEKHAFARQLRAGQTEAERLLWQRLRSRQLLGLKFRRQRPLGRYVVDFICFERMLIVELDGGQHLESDRDQARDDWLRSKGFRVLRFWNHDVFLQTEPVMEAIRQAAEEAFPGNPLTPGPSP
ncbi:endonuclease domain-containing protein [Pseudomonas sp. BN411]|nr:endonuclease domain-containing protein [Pseudomonas sp. BN411]MDH4562471.1 endonuclease domain-containing protein [Pseudomonas sp. BN411]